MKKEEMLMAFKKLDARLKTPVRLIVGGGAAMLMAYHVPISTQDVDGIPDRSSMDISEFKEEIRQVGDELKISPDWLNEHFATFLFVLPSDYGERLVSLYSGKYLSVFALSIEDLLIMKCMSGREKDIPHLRTLLKKKSNLKIVDDRLHTLVSQKIPKAEKAYDLFSDLCGEMGIDV